MTSAYHKNYLCAYHENTVFGLIAHWKASVSCLTAWALVLQLHKASPLKLIYHDTEMEMAVKDTTDTGTYSSWKATTSLTPCSVLYWYSFCPDAQGLFFQFDMCCLCFKLDGSSHELVQKVFINPFLLLSIETYFLKYLYISLCQKECGNSSPLTGVHKAS